LYGLEAINASNGWSMAVLGATIVFCGLVILSLAISQLNKLLSFFDKSPAEATSYSQKGAPPVAQPPQHPLYCPEDVQAAANIYAPLAAELGSTFKLADLYTLSRKYDFPHPHITISRLRDARLLLPEGGGVFSWNTSDI
jgi:Na+-transporting methylmalonyl-CoA/oxaloacetate decarboxylase gamma subunit